MAITDLADSLPVSVYATTAGGSVTYANAATERLLGHALAMGADHLHGPHRFLWKDGRPMTPGDCLMTGVVRSGQPAMGTMAMVESANRSVIPFSLFQSVQRDPGGGIAGLTHTLVANAAEEEAMTSTMLASIVSSSDDAIISKSLEGIVTSWNAGAARIFGYSAEEMIGQPIVKVIPRELQSEEADIIARLKQGERIEHFETTRIGKNGRRIQVSLTVSPLRDTSGRIVGASKVARDVTERKRLDDLQKLLFDELNHRVKNTLATVQAIASQSLRRTANPAEFVSSFSGRIQSLGRAHDLLVGGHLRGAQLHEVVSEQVVLGESPDSRITVFGPPVMLDARLTVQLALALHELATNARKYGALSIPGGALSITWTVSSRPQELTLIWREANVPKVSPPTGRGFGTTLISSTVAALAGSVQMNFAPRGLVCTMVLPVPDAQIGPGVDLAAAQPAATPGESEALAPRTVLLIEDEPLLAMDVQAQLMGAGYDVIGPAHSVAAALEAIETGGFDCALVDANLGGSPVHRVVAQLRARGIPFAFATGYGAEFLPEDFRNAPVLQKPFNAQALLGIVKRLASPA